MTTYAYLGPAGTFTEAALRQITNESDVLVPYSNVTAALDAVRNGKAEKVLVPIENSVEGVVSRTLDELALGTPLVVTAETTLPVTFSLMTLPDRAGDEITKIATHPHAESQCRSYVAKNYPQAEIIEMSSTAAAAKGLANGNYDAAIASDIAAKNYGLKVIASNIGDNAGAVAMAHNPVKHALSKHVDIADHYSRELLAEGLITVTKYPTAEMIADIMTKPLDETKFIKHEESLVG